MHTEITDKGGGGRLLYDADCSLCAGLLRRLRRVLARAGVEALPLQQAGNKPLTEMELVCASGKTFGGADAFLQVLRRLWWGVPFLALAQIPGIKPLLRAGYRAIASRRHCFGGSCAAPRTNLGPADSARL